jgi:drug/metabolite transporter (DMT)-like permease
MPSMSVYYEYAIVFFKGQAISILMSLTGIFASLLTKMTPSSNYPLLLLFFIYILLCGFNFVRYCRQSGDDLLKSSSSIDSNEVSETNIHEKERYMLARSMYFQPKESEISEISQESKTGFQNIRNIISSWAIPMENENPYIGWYILAAFLDVQANFLVVSAFNYTNFTSIALLDSFTIPFAMLTSSFFLNSVFQKWHYIGVCICIIGLVCVVASDLLVKQELEEKESNKKGDIGTIDENTAYLIGDLMCICGAFLYACSNVLQEKLVKYSSRELYLGRLGMFGCVIAGIQFMCVEFHSLRNNANLSSDEFYLWFSLFVTSMFLFYVSVSAFLQEIDTVFFNMSLLTADVYAVIYTYVFLDTNVHWLYFVAFSITGIGLYIYYSGDCPQSNYERSLGLYKEKRQRDKGNRKAGNDIVSEGCIQGEISDIESVFSYNPLSGKDDHTDFIDKKGKQEETRGFH